MHCIVFYDITSDRIRKKVADTCEDYGLDRTQFSAFVGYLSRSQQRELVQKMKDLLGEEAGALLLIPLNQTEWDKRMEFRQDAPGDGISTHPSTIADQEPIDDKLY